MNYVQMAQFITGTVFIAHDCINFRVPKTQCHPLGSRENCDRDKQIGCFFGCWFSTKKKITTPIRSVLNVRYEPESCPIPWGMPTAALAELCELVFLRVPKYTSRSGGCFPEGNEPLKVWTETEAPSDFNYRPRFTSKISLQAVPQRLPL